MQSDILAELVTIKWTMLALFIAVFITILFFVISVAFKVKAGNTAALLVMRDNLLAELSLLESKGEHEQLLEKAETMLSMYPNDMLAHWYAALAYRQTGQLGAALSSLGHVKAINSAWNAEAVDELIAVIKSEMSGPRATDT